MRCIVIVPDLPLLLPLVKAYASVAAVQSWNVNVPLPTTAVFGIGTDGASNTPPVVS